ncbi:MAG: hypothetical protein PHW04_12840 [Candidatus Wallbacteria bacterium]|nr:hypothetical protein [Candidatus Wallbacteria bacterium]
MSPKKVGNGKKKQKNSVGAVVKPEGGETVRLQVQFSDNQNQIKSKSLQRPK